MLKVMEFKLHLSSPGSPTCQDVFGPSSLERQPSTASLPSKRFSQQVGSVQKARLSYSLKRIRRRKKVNKAAEAETVNLNHLPESYQDLKKLHSDFKQFLNMVVEDLAEKMDKLQKYKHCDTVTAHEKNFANLQLYMLTKYSNRIETFNTLASQRVENICLAHNKKSSSDSVTNLVNKYGKTVNKMKRRMKDMIDVTDKYAVVDIFDTLIILNEASKDLDCLDSSHDKTRRSVVSLGSGEEISQDKNISTVSTRSDMTGSLSQERKSQTLRSLSDHLWVLRRTYLK